MTDDNEITGIACVAPASTAHLWSGPDLSPVPLPATGLLLLLALGLLWRKK